MSLHFFASLLKFAFGVRGGAFCRFLILPLPAVDPLFHPTVISKFTLQPTELTVEQRPVGRD